MTDSLTTLEAEITAAGHQLERTYEGAVADSPGSDPTIAAGSCMWMGSSWPPVDPWDGWRRRYGSGGRATRRSPGDTRNQKGRQRMANRSSRRRKERKQSNPDPKAGKQAVPSLLDAMEDGNEYGSIVPVTPAPGLDLMDELVRSLKEIEELRERPCLAYVGNVVRPDGQAGIDSSDDLPFSEMVSKVDSSATKVDVFLGTNGGSAHQVSRFVNALRSRFEEVDFLIPSLCMSAGTIFALSGDRIWMNPGACFGPIDPQVPSRDGRYVPAQALLLLVDKLQQDGEKALAEKKPIPWSAVRIIDSIDKKELGDAITASKYSITMVEEYLLNYKFRSWDKRLQSRAPVTAPEKEQTARMIAEALASHDRWKSHGHAISREVLWDKVELLIDHPDSNLERALRRAWALFYWMFDKGPALKFLVSKNYRFVRQRTATARRKDGTA